MGFFHPLHHQGIVRLGHQQRQAKAMQKPLDCAFPVTLAVTHFHQLADKRQGGLSQTRSLAQRGANRNLLGIYIAAAAFEAGNFQANCGMAFTALAQISAFF